MEKTKRKMGLGKGLDVIFASKPVAISKENENEKWDLSLDDIEMNPYQPRSNFDKTALEELKVSIQNQGIIQPIAVRKLKNGKFQLISGERRYQASKLAGLKSIPAYVREATDIQMLEMGIIENIQRENLNPVELAISFQRLLVECNIKQEELGNRVGKDRSTVNNYLRLLQLPQLILDGLVERKLSMGHARTLLSLNDDSKLLKIYSECISKEYSVRKLEELIKKANSPADKPSKTAKPQSKFILEDYQNELSRIFGLNVSVVSNQKNGEIKIPFSSKLELDQIIESIKK